MTLAAQRGVLTVPFPPSRAVEDQVRGSGALGYYLAVCAAAQPDYFPAWTEKDVRSPGEARVRFADRPPTAVVNRLPCSFAHRDPVLSEVPQGEHAEHHKDQKSLRLAVLPKQSADRAKQEQPQGDPRSTFKDQHSRKTTGWTSRRQTPRFPGTWCPYTSGYHRNWIAGLGAHGSFAPVADRGQKMWGESPGSDDSAGLRGNGPSKPSGVKRTT